MWYTVLQQKSRKYHNGKQYRYAERFAHKKILSAELPHCHGLEIKREKWYNSIRIYSGDGKCTD